MILADKNKDTKLASLIPAIRRSISDWFLVNINLLKQNKDIKNDVIQKLLKTYKHKEGLIYAVSDKKIVMIIHFGTVHNFAYIKKEIEGVLPEQNCRVSLKPVNEVGMKEIQLDLIVKDELVNLKETKFEQREKRVQNVFIIADDEPLVCKTMSRLLGISGDVIEVNNGDNVLKFYHEHNPDILFLDIHMPGRNGLDLINEILEIDPDAYIIILSADSSADNVVKAINKGAIGFLSKPPAKDRMQQYINQCITIR